MSLTITDFEVYIDADGVSHPLTGPSLVVIARPTAVPLTQNVGGTFNEDQLAQRRAPVTASTGAWSVTLPWPSETRYSAGTELWQVRRMNGSIYQGYVPEGTTGPLSLDTLVQSYGVGTAYKWQIVQAGAYPAAPFTAVPGPPGTPGDGVITVKGGLAVGNAAGAAAELFVGADGQLPFAASSASLGLQWRAIAGGDLPPAGVNSLGAIFKREVNPRTYGAVLDNASHPLSGAYANLTAARLVYPFATDMAQELDYCGIQKAINVALGTETSPAPSLGDPSYPTPVPTRVATAVVTVSGGTGAHINSPLNMVGASGLVISAPGVRFTPANVPGGSTLSSVFHWDGIADCAFSDLQVVAGDGTEDITEVFSYQWTGSGAVGRSSTHNVFRRCGVQGARYRTGWAIGTSSGALQVDQSSWYDCTVTGNGVTPQTDATYFQDNWKLGSGTSGNIIGLGLHNCQSFWGIRGINVAEAKGVLITNMTLQGNALDYQIASEDAVTIDTFRSEGGGMFMKVGSGPTASACLVDVRNGGWSAAHATDDGTGHYKWAELDWAGIVRFQNCRIEGNAPGHIVPYVNGNPDTVSNSGLAQLTVILDGMQAPTTAADFCRGNTHVAYEGVYLPITNTGGGFSSGGFGAPTRLVTGKIALGAVGSSGSTFDNANLYRGGANLLETDGSFQVGTNLQVAGSVQPSASTVLVAQQATGGVDETITTAYEAQKFTPLSTVTAGTGIVASVWAKAATANSNTTCAVAIYTDNAGVPGTQIAGNIGALQTSGLSTGSYTQVYLALTGAASDLVAGTLYWLVIHLGSGFIVDSTTTTGTNVVATSANGTTWTLAGGTKSLRYLIDTKVASNLVSSATYGIPLAGSSAAFQALSGTSTHAAGVSGTSTHQQGVQGISTGYFGGQFNSTWQEGVYAASQQGIGAHALQTGALVANNTSAALLVERTGTPGTFAFTEVPFEVIDNPTGTDSATNLVRLRSKLAGVLADRWVVDKNGSLITGTVPIGQVTGTIPVATHASTHEPGGSDDLAAHYGHLSATEIPNIPRYDMSTQISGLVSGTTNGTLYLSYFTAPVGATITQLLMRTSLTAAVFGGTAPGLFAGLYAVDGSGNLALVFQSADLHTTAFAAPSTAYQLPLTKDGAGSALASYTFTPRTQRYAYALLIVNATTPPTLVGQGGVSDFLGRSPKISGSVVTQATLPTPISAGSVSSTGVLLGFIGLP